MKWMTRINGILSANAHDFLDRWENPERQLREAVREMEASLARTIDRSVTVIAQEKILDRQVVGLREQHDRWSERAAAALADGDEPAARAALRRKLECARLAASLDEQLVLLRASTRRLRAQVAQMREHLHVAKARLATLVARHAAAEAKRKAHQEMAETVVDDRAYGTFRRMAERIERSEAEADALVELTACDIEEVACEDDIELQIAAELEAMKR